MRSQLTSNYQPFLDLKQMWHRYMLGYLKTEVSSILHLISCWLTEFWVGALFWVSPICIVWWAKTWLPLLLLLDITIPGMCIMYINFQKNHYSDSIVKIANILYFEAKWIQSREVKNSTTAVFKWVFRSLYY